jgi:ABC-type transport system involved in cytochrome c biogenesis ATPase subunit
MRMTIWPAEAFAAIWQNNSEKRQDDEERRRIEHADKIKHALTVLEGLRSWNLESGKGHA